MKYRKKPVVIEAIQWTGSNANEVIEFTDADGWVFSSRMISIPTLEGVMQASAGDFIIKGVQGEFYPCKPDIFEQTYEAVTE